MVNGAQLNLAHERRCHFGAHIFLRRQRDVSAQLLEDLPSDREAKSTASFVSVMVGAELAEQLEKRSLVF